MAPAGSQLQPQAENGIDRAVAAHRQGRLEDAARIYGEILTATPDQPDALNLLGLLRHQQSRNIEALQLIGAALQRGAQSADIVNNFALVLSALGRREEALAAFERALAIDRNHVNALNNRASALARAKRNEEALITYRRLLEVQPNHLAALNESGGLYMRLGQAEAALACYDRAIAASPLPELYVNKGTALRALKRDDEALASFATAARLKPDFAEAHWNASLVRLRHGDFARGWKDYEWRWRKADWAGRQRHFSAPLWLGEQPIAGKTILLHAEQGFGDTIQFVRYAALAAGLGATVVLECPPQLKSLLDDVNGVARVISHGEAPPPVDFQCPLMSLPWAFRTELATVPADVPYIRPPAERIVKWRGKLPQSGRWRVGLCWSGSKAHPNDDRRSIPLEDFSGLFSVPGIDFVSLQKDVAEQDTEILRAHGVAELGRDFADFADTAAVMTMIDLIITVDTAVAHLAGAMAKAVAVLVAFSPDWRWMLERTDTPWYPTARLFRQPAIGDWHTPFERLRGELAALAGRRSAGAQPTACG